MHTEGARLGARGEEGVLGREGIGEGGGEGPARGKLGEALPEAAHCASLCASHYLGSAARRQGGQAARSEGRARAVHAGAPPPTAGMRAHVGARKSTLVSSHTTRSIECAGVAQFGRAQDS